MKSWRMFITLAVLGMTAFTSLAASAFSQELMGRKQLYLFSLDFPSDPLVQYPSPPVKETKFWQLLDREIQATNDLALTENMEHADYRVELRCSGIFNCSKLTVDVKDAERNVLASFPLKNFAPFWGLGAPNLHKVSQELALRLDERIRALPQGGYGYEN